MVGKNSKRTNTPLKEKIEMRNERNTKKLVIKAEENKKCNMRRTHQNYKNTR